MKPFQPDLQAVVALVHDAVALVVSWAFAFALLRGLATPSEAHEIVLALLVAVPLQGLVTYLFGVYQGIWRYTSLPDVQRIIFAVLSGTVLVAIAHSVTGMGSVIGYREYLLYPLILVAIMAGSRMAMRSFKEWSMYGRGGDHGAPVVVMGAGDAAVSLLKELSRSPEWRVMGLLDDDIQKRGRLLHGVRVLGALDHPVGSCLCLFRAFLPLDSMKIENPSSEGSGGILVEAAGVQPASGNLQLQLLHA